MALEAGLVTDPILRLTPDQLEAVSATDPRLAVYAGAGAGKTRVLTLRAARLVDEGVDPSHLLIVTFSRKAASELRSRLWRLNIEGVRAGTFHRTALELIENYRLEQGLGPPRLLVDRRRALGRVAERVLTAPPPHAAAALDTEVSWAKAWGLSPETYEAERTRRGRRSSLPGSVVAEVWAAYETAKTRQGSLDFDDLLIDAAALLDDPTIAAAVHWRTRHVLVDEFQDVNPLQFALIERLVTDQTTLFCVGDPNQSIYGFNGADPSLLRQLDRRFPGTRVIALDANFRSSPEIVEAAAAVLPPEDQRPTAASQASGDVPTLHCLADDRDEARHVAERIYALRGPRTRWRSFAVLARTNAQLDVVASVLDGAGIPTAPLAPDLTAASDVRSPTASPRVEHDEMVDAVALGTFHRAKGLEWPYVFVIGVSDGLVPHAGASSPAALDEERRLLYVALTRAERGLSVSWATRRDGEEPARAPTRSRSPFLDPIARVVEQLARESGPGEQALGAQRAAALRRQLDEQRAQQPEGER